MAEKVSRKINRGWTTRDIMVTAIISIALGVLYIPLAYILGLLYAIPLAYSLTVGISFWPIIMVAYLIRKPGVAIFSAMVTSLVQVPFTPFGIVILVTGLLIGLPTEATLLSGRYKNFKLWYLMLTGAITGLVNAMLLYISMGFGNISPLLQIVYLSVYVISGAVLGGMLAKVIGDLVIRTGIITPIR
jgi:energy-coupling factor transport system substrate-specific component